MPHQRDHLANALRDPQRLARASLSDWDFLIPEARRAGLLGRLADIVERSFGLEVVPEKVRAHLVSASILAEKRRREVLFEIDRLVDLLKDVLGTVVLLKGAAYIVAGLAPAAGRIFNDIDILVPKTELAAVEAILSLGGWRLGEIDPYDEEYYRRWMHQLPPLVNAARKSVIDVHHTVVPTTARIALDAHMLFERVVPVPGNARLAVLSPPDMVLHSAVHLFSEGEFEKGLRDLDDLNLLLQHFGQSGEFWEALLSRALALDLNRPLYYALRYTTKLLGTRVPLGVARETDRYRPGRAVLDLMDAAFGRALCPPHPDCRDALTGTALALLYVRSHYLRMPLHLLIPHLVRKGVRHHAERPAEA
jgi:hypothetical protein